MPQAPRDAPVSIPIERFRQETGAKNPAKREGAPGVPLEQLREYELHRGFSGVIRAIRFALTTDWPEHEVAWLVLRLSEHYVELARRGGTVPVITDAAEDGEDEPAAIAAELRRMAGRIARKQKRPRGGATRKAGGQKQPMP